MFVIFKWNYYRQQESENSAGISTMISIKNAYPAVETINKTQNKNS